MTNPAHSLGICDRCGFEKKLNALRKEWNGLKVCSQCFEPRHPQDHLKGGPDRQALRDPRPDPEPVYLDVNDVTADDL